MKVNHAAGNPVPTTEANHTKHSGRAAGSPEVKKARSEHVPSEKANSADGANAEISEKGRAFATAKQAAADAPDVREEKIAELREKMAAGKYKINANAIADKMVDDHLKMSGIG